MMTPLLGTLVGSEDKFAAHNAALWKNGLLRRRPERVVLERPLYVAIANTAPRRLARSGACSSSPRRIAA